MQQGQLYNFGQQSNEMLNDEFSKWQPDWQKCEDVFEGEPAVKQANAVYLPPVGNPLLTLRDAASYSAYRNNLYRNEDYYDYKNRAIVSGAFSRAVWSALGSLFRREWALMDAESEAWMPFLNNVTLTGHAAAEFYRYVLQQVLISGRYGCLVNWSEGMGQPYLSGWHWSQILDWHEVEQDGARKLQWVLLCETTIEHKPEEGKPFQKEAVQRYWMPQLDDMGQYEIRAYEKAEDKDELIELPELYRRPMIGGRTLTEVPFFFFNAYDNEPAPKAPPLLALANLVLDNYRLDADHKQALHIVGSPTPYLFAEDAEGEGDLPPVDYTEGESLDARRGRRQEEAEAGLQLGPKTAIVSADNDAQTGYLSLSSEDLSGLRDEKEKNEKRMAMIGGRILESPATHTEAARTVGMRQAGEMSALQLMAVNAASTFTGIFGVVADFLRQPKPMLRANTDFYEATLTPQEQMALADLWERGLLAEETVAYNLRRGELLPPDMTVAEYVAELRERARRQKRVKLPDTGQSVKD